MKTIIAMLVVVGVAVAGAAEKVERDLGVMMLRRAKGVLTAEYYDPGLKGFPLNERIAEAEARIAKAESNPEIFRIIGQVFMDLNDSHTRFYPPPKTYRVKYGWAATVVGDACYVRWVDPKSDAAKKGLRRGDRIETIEGIPARRATLWKIEYLFNSLDPQSGLRLAITTPTGEAKELELMAQVKQEPKKIDFVGAFASGDINKILRRSEAREKLMESAFAEVGDTFVWRLPSFSRPPGDLDKGLAKMRRAKAAILDLRGNTGGYQDTLIELVSQVFDREVKIGTVKQNSRTEPLVAKSGLFAFKGLLIVLVDGSSASASEIFARTVQLEDRGIVIGDRTKGMVQQSRIYQEEVGSNPVVVMWMAVSVGQWVMRDGKPIENVGVAPDLPVRPTGADLATGRDPVLAKALAQTGQKLTPEEAGKLLKSDRRDEEVD